MLSVDSIGVTRWDPVRRVDNRRRLCRENFHLAARALMPQTSRLRESARIDAFSSVNQESVVDTRLTSAIDGPSQPFLIPNDLEVADEVERSATDGLDLASWNRCGSHRQHVRAPKLELVLSD